MAAALKYVLDTNVLIEASRRYYPFDFARPFWRALVDFANEGVICSVDRVSDEIINGNDELKNWAQNEFSAHFRSTHNPAVFDAYAHIVTWAQAQTQYNQRAKDVFMDINNADASVVAFALSSNIKVVTQEAIARDAQRVIPIPNVCESFSIGYCNTFEMLRELGFTF